jgi:hypothetical protein
MVQEIVSVQKEPMSCMSFVQASRIDYTLFQGPMRVNLLQYMKMGET